MSHPRAFVASTAILALFLSASAAPSPLYVVYQQQWHFSETTLTGVFAIYVIGLLGSLLVVGGLSDHLGRRPVLGAAVALEAVAMLLFLTAGGVPELVAARFLQGVATGAAMTTLAAALIDLNPPHAPQRAGVVNSITPTSALAFGALACGALVQFAPAPTHLVFAVILAGLVLSAAVVLTLPETSSRRPGAVASLRPRMSVPGRIRVEFTALVPVLLASWAVGGIYLSLGPSVAVGVFGLQNHLVGGFVVALLCGTGAVTSWFLREVAPAVLLRLAAGLLAFGLLITLAGVEWDVAGLAGLGTVLAGIGFGSGGIGCFGTLSRIALPDERSQLFAVGLTVSYLAFSIPAVIAGFAATSYGLHATVLTYGAAIVVLSVGALAAQRVLDSRRDLVPA
ncbi:MFS transporter [Spongisporangium articulatum]|uniref:MFS transporter n=1 Tax=Spongisporangium articulatum TaxID=3362603 RepID=A0ABW8AJM1_9ACTN